ncbi:Swt1 family HEPN domain-containing protein [Psychrobacillus sp. MER TA 171]|uniref:Swt1 family HEPN domain-containing protein n=1 Tax=Psychrobacillus sp. MER TA 171 TaxID=2939577 RepID=UPI00203E86D5|nr:Swt1 family HEPN domain-containing protein [Psychrobacillus sp. MER TA 171]MCM3358134.1 Swt1 family HEPN domain-containing protein [Psychrobacillus sp. MER TA 171]
MSNFTYQLPFTEEKLLTGVLLELKRARESELSMHLQKSVLSIEELGMSYYIDNSSDSRWNATGINIKFIVNPNYLDNLDTMENKIKLETICQRLIPATVGFDIKEILFVPDLISDFELEDDILLEFETRVNTSSNSILKSILPEDIREKGLYMAETYTYLYLVENSLRLFIENVAKESFGEEYFEKLTISSSLRNTITSRKIKEQNQKWLSVRGGNDLFYLDFKDISTLINNNWNLFKEYFPSQEFISQKITEMADCRNLIAHNSFVSKDERDLMKVYYNSILKQIEQTMKKKTIESLF